MKSENQPRESGRVLEFSLVKFMKPIIFLKQAGSIM